MSGLRLAIPHHLRRWQPGRAEAVGSVTPGLLRTRFEHCGLEQIAASGANLRHDPVRNCRIWCMTIDVCDSVVAQKGFAQQPARLSA
jgi:hypothetical protein